jgi:hypothetical protein
MLWIVCSICLWTDPHGKSSFSCPAGILQFENLGGIRSERREDAGTVRFVTPAMGLQGSTEKIFSNYLLDLTNYIS